MSADFDAKGHARDYLADFIYEGALDVIIRKIVDDVNQGALDLGDPNEWDQKMHFIYIEVEAYLLKWGSEL